MNTRFDFPVILLAAGQSTRMRGRDKLLEDVDGVPLLRRQAVRARAATSSHVLIALPQAPHPRYAAIEGLDVTPVPVTDAHEGMNASLRGAIAALPARSTHAMIVLADMPELTVADLCAVAQSIAAHPTALIWRGATETGQPGHPTVFHHSLFATLGALRGEVGGKDVIAAHQDRVQLVPLPKDHARLDLDTPEAWQAWRAAQAT